MQEDERCCGTGTCLINAEGYCWCGQRWDGNVMCAPSAVAGFDQPVQRSGAEPQADGDTVAQ
jgi:hypothetical protein